MTRIQIELEINRLLQLATFTSDNSGWIDDRIRELEEMKKSLTD